MTRKDPLQTLIKSKKEIETLGIKKLTIPSRKGLGKGKWPRKISTDEEIWFPSFWIRSTGQWAIVYKNGKGHHRVGIQIASTEADTRGKMLIYLLENNLIKLQ